jgi:hypothetical protein
MAFRSRLKINSDCGNLGNSGDEYDKNRFDFYRQPAFYRSIECVTLAARIFAIAD